MFELLAGQSVHAIAGQVSECNERMPGLYVAQSQADDSLFRFGESQNLASRRSMHAGPAAHAGWAKPPNWTETYRPWKFRWAAVFPNANRCCVRKCEDLLSGTLAEHFEAVDPSGFRVPRELHEVLSTVLNPLIPRFQKIADMQTGAFFNKNVYWLPKMVR